MKFLSSFLLLGALALTNCTTNHAQIQAPAVEVEVEIPHPSPQIIWHTPPKTRLPTDRIILVRLGKEDCKACDGLEQQFRNPILITVVNGGSFYPIYLDVYRYPELAAKLNPDHQIPALILFTTQDIKQSDTGYQINVLKLDSMPEEDLALFLFHLGNLFQHEALPSFGVSQDLP